MRDNLKDALEGAAGYASVVEVHLQNGNWRAAAREIEQVHAHLDWACEILHTRAQAAKKAAKGGR